MHYTGNYGISNYDVTIYWPYFGGAIAIACSTMTLIMLGISAAQDRRVRLGAWRFCCSFIMALTVTTMHFEASLGVSYKLKKVNYGSPWALEVIPIVAGALTGITIIICAAIILYARKQRQEAKKRPQQVVLACLWFDPRGRVLVSKDGSLPCRQLTRREDRGDFDEDFNIGHSVFQWIYKVSHNWCSVKPFLHQMQQHLDVFSRDPYITSRNQHTQIFRERFCTAAEDMARDLKVDIVDIGCLYGGVMSSGSERHTRRGSRTSNNSVADPELPNFSLATDLEAQRRVVGEGKMLFLGKCVSKKDVPKVQNEGYRFMALSKLSSTLAAAMQVPMPHVQEYVRSIYRQTSPMLGRFPQHITLGFFGLRTQVLGNRFDVLTTKDDYMELPMVSLWSKADHKNRSQFLHLVAGKTVTSILDILRRGLNGWTCEAYAQFCRDFGRALTKLQVMVNEDWFDNAFFSTSLHDVPTGQPTGKNTTYSMLAFHCMPNVHFCQEVKGANLQFLPFDFFKCRNQVLTAPNDIYFAAEVYEQLAKELAEFNDGVAGTISGTTLASSWRSLTSARSSRRRLLASTLASPPPSDISLRNVVITSDASVEAEVRSPGDGEGNARAGAERAEVPVSLATFVDALFAATVRRFGTRRV